MDILSTSKPDIVTTPPQNPRHNFPNLHPVECLLSSPVTPTVRRRRYPFHPVTQPESACLAMMLESAFRHRSIQSSLITLTNEIGNGAYIPRRTVVINWLVEVCANFHFEPSTLHLAVRHLDWFMALEHIHQSSWQLCAITALFIAAKCEEPGEKVPVVYDLAFLCEGAYTPRALRGMEKLMLLALRWDLIAKTPVHFLTYYLSLVRSRLHTVAVMRFTDELDERKRQRADAMSGKKVKFLDVDMWDDDSDDESYKVDMDLCACEDECYCGYDDLYDEDENGDGDLECDEDMLPERSESPDAPLDEKAILEAMYELQRVAHCLMDLSLFDLDMQISFEPNVIAAAALAMAVDIAEIEGVELVDICTITCVSPAEMGPCRTILAEHFARAQIVPQAHDETHRKPTNNKLPQNCPF